MTIPVLFADDAIVAVDKPSGLSVHRGYDRGEDVLVDRLEREHGARLHPVHRLDRGTSGVVLFARSPAVAARLQVALGLADKRYLALVRGVPPDAGRIDHPVPKDEGGERVPAVTVFRRLGRSDVERVSLVEARPETGRFHQVRRHMKHLHHPLIGDTNYGRGELNRWFRARYGFGRLALHARSIALSHPLTGASLLVEAPLPADLSALFAALGLAP